MKKKIIVLLTILLLFAVWLAGFYRVNEKYPYSPMEKYEQEESVFVGGLGVTVQVADWRFATQDEKARRVGDAFDPNEVEMILLDIVVTNTTNSEQTGSFFPFYLESPDIFWANAVFYPGILAAESSPTVMYTLQPGDSVSKTLPYTVYRYAAGENVECDLRDFNYQLILQLYPVKKVITLQ